MNIENPVETEFKEAAAAAASDNIPPEMQFKTGFTAGYCAALASAGAILREQTQEDQDKAMSFEAFVERPLGFFSALQVMATAMLIGTDDPRTKLMARVHESRFPEWSVAPHEPEKTH